MNDKILNGVDVSLLGQTVEAIKQDSDLADFQFRVKNHWVSGAYSRSTVDDFYGTKKNIDHVTSFEIHTDEPPVLAGQDRGVNPTEHLLSALGACITTSMVYHAALRGIKVDAVESELSGDIDLRGFMGLSSNVRSGFSNIKAKIRVKTDRENLSMLREFGRMSPVFDMTSNGTDIDLEIEQMI